ncbi:MAG: hypothetical protein ACYSW4_01900 [Planctomycetota bacterium]|jgi:hypothetical protein
MKAVGVVVKVFFFVLLLVEAGCEPRPPEPPPTGNGSNPLLAYASYAAEKIDIIPLTGFVLAEVPEESSQLKVYVSLLDSFDCQIKSPGVFRFELYQHVQRSADPKGRRIVIWPEVDLTGAAENNSYWRDFLRAYEFSLDFEPQSNHTYVLEVTLLGPSGRRLSDDFIVKNAE